jgi:hypothetical protein
LKLCCHCRTFHPYACTIDHTYRYGLGFHATSILSSAPITVPSRLSLPTSFFKTSSHPSPHPAHHTSHLTPQTPSLILNHFPTLSIHTQSIEVSNQSRYYHHHHPANPLPLLVSPILPSTIPEKKHKQTKKSRAQKTKLVSGTHPHAPPPCPPHQSDSPAYHDSSPPPHYAF